MEGKRVFRVTIEWEKEVWEVEAGSRDEAIEQVLSAGPEDRGQCLIEPRIRVREVGA